MAKSESHPLLKLLPAATFGLMVWASQTSPDAAQTNLQAWFQAIDVPLPGWLTAKVIFWGGGTLLLAFYLVSFRKPLARAWRALRKDEQSAGEDHPESKGSRIEDFIVTRMESLDAKVTLLEAEGRQQIEQIEQLTSERQAIQAQVERLRRANESTFQQWKELHDAVAAQRDEAFERGQRADKAIAAVFEALAGPTGGGLFEQLQRPAISVEERVDAAVKILADYQLEEGNRQIADGTTYTLSQILQDVRDRRAKAALPPPAPESGGTQ